MKTEQAIRKLGQTLWDILGREYIDKYCEDKNGNLVSVSSISVDEIAEELVNSGYGNISEYKAEIERLKNNIIEQEKEIELLKMQLQDVVNHADTFLVEEQKFEAENVKLKAEIERLRTTLGQCNTELNSALESLKSQCREIGELKAGVKQAQIDVLNELRERITKDRVANDTVVINASYEIDELIKEIRAQ